MISLYKLFEDISKQPKAIFLAGPAGSGKSFWSKQLIPDSFQIINSDDTYEEMLKKSGIGLKQKDFTPDQLSKASKMQAQARKVTDEKLRQAMESRNNLVIDGTGASSKTVLKKKKELEELGYESLMLMIYVSPLVSLERNSKRERSLMPFIVLRTWKGINQNIPVYKTEFNENFLLINNNPENTEIEFSEELIKPYLEDQKAKGKPKTPEQEAKSRKEKNELIKTIESMVDKLPESNTIEQVKTKLNQFING